MKSATLTRGQLAAYSAFSLPLAMAALPIYVHVPKFYGGTLGMPLALVGMILLVARLFDALQDPIFGYLSDRATQSRHGRRLLVMLGLPLLAMGFVMMFHPPGPGQTGLAMWLIVSLLIVYIGFSMASISYFAIGAELSTDYHERTRVTATRGAFGVLGVLIAAAIPEVLSTGDEAQGLRVFSLLFLPVLFICGFVTLRYSPRQVVAAEAKPRQAWAAMYAPFRNARFRWLMAIFVLSGIAGAIPATLILFYVQDVLQRADLSGVFLGLYFLFGALGMPAWIAASRRLGKRYAWLLGMFLAVAAFVWAYSLGAGDLWAFAVVCAMSGVAYGAELAMPASMLADVVDVEEESTGQRPDGAYFGLWQMIEKLNLAVAAGIALPLLGYLGYRPGTAQDAFAALPAVYALLPCAIKLAAATLLWFAPIDGARSGRPLQVSQGGPV